jgi:hypothetical protein
VALDEPIGTLLWGGGGVFDQLSDSHVLKKDSVQW